MTYMNNMMQSQQSNISGAVGQAGSMFQPGYANTNVQEVQYWNQGGHSPAVQPTYGMSYGGGIGTQAMFQPGYANTNVQEVRQLNSGYAAPQQQAYQQVQPINYLHPQNVGYMHTQPSGYMLAQSTYQPAYSGATNSIFSPNFAGTNIQEVRQRNNSGFSGYTGQTGYIGSTGYASPVGSVFSPGFAGTNAQEVRQLNQGGIPSAGIMSSGFGLQPQLQQQGQAIPSYGTAMGTGAQAVFSPGFAGTNVQEVRTLNSGGQIAGQIGSIFPGSI